MPYTWQRVSVIITIIITIMWDCLPWTWLHTLRNVTVWENVLVATRQLLTNQMNKGIAEGAWSLGLHPLTRGQAR